MKQLVFSLAMALLSFSTSTTLAAPIALSAIPLSSDAIPAARAMVHLVDIRTTPAEPKDTRIIAAMDRPVCLRQSDDSGPGRAVFYVQYDAKVKLIVERLVEGSAPYLERLLVDPTSNLAAATLLGRDRVPLLEVASSGEVKVYAYRTTKQVHVLAPRGFDSPRDAFEPSLRMDDRMECGLMHIDLDVTGSARASGLLSVAHAMTESDRWVSNLTELFAHEEAAAKAKEPPPVAASKFALNASLSKVSRDPEPLLSVVFMR